MSAPEAVPLPPEGSPAAYIPSLVPVDPDATAAPRPVPPERPHPFFVGLLLGALAVALWLVLNPSAEVPSEAVTSTRDWLVAKGVDPALLDEGAPVEFALNLLMFVPLTFFGSLVYRMPVLSWIGVGFLASLSIEAYQLFLLPDRDATTVDLVSNTLGAMVGAVLAAPLVWWLRRRRRKRWLAHHAH